MKNRTEYPPIHVLTRSEITDIVLQPEDVIKLVEHAYCNFAAGDSFSPTKLMVTMPASQDSVAYSMLGYAGDIQQIGFKTSYRQGNNTAEKYYTTISLYDDITGLPYVFMDCQRVGALRTPATTALIARSCAKPDAESILMVGTGIQGRNTLAYVLTVLPHLKQIRLFGTHSGGIAETLTTTLKWFPDVKVELIDDVEAICHESDIVVAASGRAAHPKIDTKWLPKGGLLISVASKGVAAGALANADYTVATNESQVGVTGTRLAGPDATLTINAELPDILLGSKLGRIRNLDRVFAFSSGMVITDIPVAHALATKAIAAGRGKRIELWS